MIPATQDAFPTAGALTVALFGRSFVAPTHWPASATFVYRAPDEPDDRPVSTSSPVRRVRVDRSPTVVSLALQAVRRSGSKAAQIFEAVRRVRPETTRVQIGSALGRLVATGRVRRREDGLYFVSVR